MTVWAAFYVMGWVNLGHYFSTEVMPDLPNDVAHDWFGLATWALICSVAALFVRGYFKLKTSVDETKGFARHTSNVAAETKEQITNGHPNLFRQDFDKLVGEVRAEREERRSDVAELRAEVNKRVDGLHDKLDQLLRHVK